MEKLKAQLSRKVGPFTVGVWIIIVVVGVALGLMLRTRLGVGSDNSGLAVSEAVPQRVGASPGFTGIGGGVGMGPQGPQTGGGSPSDGSGGSEDAVWTPLRRDPSKPIEDDRGMVIKIPIDPKPINPPTPIRTTIPKIDPDSQLKAKIIAEFTSRKLDPPSAARLTGLVAEVKAGRPISNIGDGLDAFLANSGGGSSATTYVVKPGDTLSAIGSRFGVSASSIYSANRSVIGSNPDLIKPGQKLRIPSK